MAEIYWARTDSNTANNANLNLTGAPAVQIEFLDQTLGGADGDFVLEGDAVTPDPDTVVSIGGQVYSFSLDMVATLPTLNNQGAGQVPDQFEGDPVYTIVVYDYPTAGETTRLTFLPESDATQAEMDAFGNGAIEVQNTDLNPPPTPLCFAEGTKILTPRGEVSVEEMQVGDTVLVADGAPMAIRWIGASRYELSNADQNVAPIKIETGAFGADLPSRPLILSPQHKIAVSGAGLEMHFGVDEALAPACGFVGHPGVTVLEGQESVTYYHILLEKHALVYAHGVASESFYPGEMSMTLVSANQKLRLSRVLTRMGVRGGEGFGPTARASLTRREIEQLVATGSVRVLGYEEYDAPSEALSA